MAEFLGSKSMLYIVIITLGIMWQGERAENAVKDEIYELKESRQAYIDSAKIHFDNYQTLKSRYNEVVGRFYQKTAKADSIHNLAPIKVNYEGVSNDSIMRDINNLLNDNLPN